MIVTEVPWRPSFPSKARTDGLHLSDVLDRMHQAITGTSYEEDDPEESGAVLLGIAWETALSLEERPSSEAVIFWPDELVLDGIIMSPDAIRIDSQGLALEEFKCTKKKWDGDFHQSNKRFWRWITQAMCYAHALGTCRVTFRIMFLFGDYKEDRDHMPKRFDLEFTEEELRRNWEMVVKNKEAMSR